MFIIDRSYFNTAVTFIFVGLNICGIFFTYAYPQKTQYLFYAVPIYCLIAIKFVEPSLTTSYKEIFTLSYLIIVAISYVLCSSTIALAYSILTCLAVIIVIAGNKFEPLILGKYWFAYIVVLIAEGIIGFSIMKKVELFSKEEEIRKNSDELTNLLNKYGFTRELKKIISQNSEFYFVLMDINKFGELSDILEISKLNEILKDVALNLINFPESFAHSRFYGDRFAFISKTQNSLILNAQLNELEKSIKTTSDKYSLDNSISFSAGVVFYPEQASSIEQLFEFAELSLNKSKSEVSKQDIGNNSFFTYEYLDEKKRVSAIQKDFLSACRNGELQVFFQPKISLVNKKVTGMEALSRWTHPNVGYISPEEFVNIAEKSGHIITLGEYVIESALYHIKQVHKICSEDVTISINISPIQLMQNNFIDNIFAKAANFGIDPVNIYLEITEGTILKKGANDVISRLKDMGFNLSLDDFGTGYSSLSYLHKFKFDELKIDKSFSDGLMKGRSERQVFKFLLILAKELGMKTVTEGVEDEVQVKLLQGLGADEIQGWFYSKALSSFECLEYIRNFRFEDYDSKENINI
jgi:diguanylate cyclase (GGDEF)-like protein